MKKNDPSRRHFLAGAAALSGLALTAGLLPPTPASAEKRAGDAKTKLSEYVPQFFTEPEWRFIVAACDCLIPSDDIGPGALEAGVPVFIDRQMETVYGHGGLWYMHAPFITDVSPVFGYQYKFSPREIYRIGIADVNTHCRKQHGRLFHETGDDKQVALLMDLEKGSIPLNTMPAQVFFSQLLTNTKEGYLADPMYGGNRRMAPWKMVGFPGARGDYYDFIRQHNKPYPNAPVSIRRQEG